MRKSCRTWGEMHFWDIVNKLFGQSHWVKFALDRLSTNIYESIKFQLQSYFYFSDAEQISVLGDEDNAGISGGNDGEIAGMDSDDTPADYGDDGDDD